MFRPNSDTFRGTFGLPGQNQKERLHKTDCCNVRAPADREASIKDSGLTRTGLAVTVLCLHTATLPGRGPCLAETVWAGSREIFLVLSRNGLTGTGSVACWTETVWRESREKFPVLFGLVEQYRELE